MSCAYGFVFLLPHYKILAYSIGKDMYAYFFIHLFMQVQNFSPLFSCLYVFVLFFLLICALAWGMKNDHLPE